MSLPWTVTYRITNLQQEKAKFIADHTYNPQFTYQDPPLEEYLYWHGRLTPDLLELAEKIIDRTLTEYGSGDKLTTIEGPLLSYDYVVQTINTYLENNHITDQVNVVFSDTFVARTAVNFDQAKAQLKVRLPVAYGSQIFQATLDHEIGTHIMRWINERQQAWFNKHQEFDLKNHVETEEGLAVLHTHLTHPVPYMWWQAIYLKALSFAINHSFSQVFALLSDLIPDPEQRWILTVRVKRGLTDTSQPGGFHKDILYLGGVRKLAKYIRQQKFSVADLYLGKIDIEDAAKAKANAAQLNPIIPAFTTKPDYFDKLNAILDANFL